MIVVDTLVPHSLWTVDETQGIEVVPLEAVVAIIEIKRSLTRDALAEAVEHLTTIRDRVQVRKDLTTRFLPGGVEVGAALSSPYRSNPLLGVVGILAGSWFSEQPRERFVELLNQATNQEDAARLELDMVLSLDGTLVATGDLNAGGNYQAHNVRTSSTTYPIRESSARTGNAPRQALAFGVGFLLSYLDKSCGRMSDIEGYFFNDNLVG